MKTINFRINLRNTFLVLTWFNDRYYTEALKYNYRGYYYLSPEIRFIIRGILEQFRGIHE